MRTFIAVVDGGFICLNPCFCGVWFVSETKEGKELSLQYVLILVFVECGL